MRSPTDLSIRSRTVTLPPRTAANPLTEAPVQVIAAEGGMVAWRILDLGSWNGKPWVAKVSYAGGGGSRVVFTVSVGSAARLCIPASSVTVEAWNLYNGGQAPPLVSNSVGVLISDGFIPTSNVMEYESTVPLNAQVVQIPAFARTVRLERADVLAACTLELLNGQGTVVSTIPFSAMPPEGVAVGGAEAVRVTCASASRLTFYLHL